MGLAYSAYRKMDDAAESAGNILDKVIEVVMWPIDKVSDFAEEAKWRFSRRRTNKQARRGAI